MTAKLPLRTVSSVPVTDGAGVNIRRGIGTDALKNLDPFLMIDHFGSDNPDDYIAGFPDHPHRGFITLTYMLDGHMLHKDSMNNQGHLRAGDVQWMKAASGIIHSEMPQQEAGLMRGFQLWINLPAAEKMSDPAYQEFSADQVPIVRTPGSTVKVVAGTYQGQTGPVVDTQTQLSFFDIHLSAGATPGTDGFGGFGGLGDLPSSCFIYVYEGTLELKSSDGAATVGEHTLGVFDPGQHKAITSLQLGSKEARFVLIAGRPIGEPIVQHGPFVMNTLDEIKTAISDYQQGRLVRTKASVRVSPT